MSKTTTTTTRDPKPALYLLMTEDRSHGYLHVYGRVVTQRYESGGYQPDGPDDTYGFGTLYSGLQLRCQGDEQSRVRAIAGERDAPVYGYDCEYRDVFHVSRRIAVRMAKTLTTLEAKLHKQTEKRGDVATYGQYVGRVAEALGCVGVAYVRTPRSRETTGQRWAWVTVGEGVSWIERQIDAWVNEARPQPAEQAQA